MRAFDFLRRIDAWLLAKRLKWKAAFGLFAIMVMLVVVSMFIDGGASALLVMALFVCFILRYIRPNVRGPFDH